MNLIDKLEAMGRDELMEIAGTQGVRVHWKAKPETIIKAIVEKVSTPVKSDMQHVAEKPQAPVDHNTPEQIEAMLAPIKVRAPQFEAKYDLEENTWHFSCRGAEECGNMDIPMRVIQMKANTVSRGRLVMIGMKDFGDLPGNKPNSLYTNTVLAG